MLWRLRKRFIKRIVWTTFKILIASYVAFFVIFPLIFKYSYNLQSKAVFLNFVNLPSLPYDDPTKFGLQNTQNFYLNNENVKLGVWFISRWNTTFQGNISDGTSNIHNEDVIIYYHGNAGSRGSAHRVELYQILRKFFHVIAFDYRSYGDSSNVPPSEADVVKDSVFIYKWVQNITIGGNIFVWGHSLGTSIATQALRLLQQENILKPTGLFLEAPFNNMREEISEFPIAKIFKHLPWFTYTIVEPMQMNNFKFQTDEYILHVNTPIIILHAEDDHVVPFKLGQKLFELAKNKRREDQGSITFVPFDKHHKYSHKYICRAPELPEIISSFTLKAKIEANQKNLL